MTEKQRQSTVILNKVKSLSGQATTKHRHSEQTNDLIAGAKKAMNHIDFDLSGAANTALESLKTHLTGQQSVAMLGIVLRCG